MSSLLPPEALANFSQELSTRDARREARQAENRRVAEEDTLRMMEMEASGKGPSAAELQASEATALLQEFLKVCVLLAFWSSVVNVHHAKKNLGDIFSLLFL